MRLAVKSIALALILNTSIAHGQNNPVTSGSRQVSFPAIGAINEVSVGDQMLSQGTEKQVKGVAFASEFKAVFPFSAGFFEEYFEDDKYIYLMAKENDPTRGYGSVLPHRVLGIDMSVGGVKFKVRKDRQQVCYGGNCNSDVSYKPVLSERIFVADNEFQQTLIYNGGNAKKIKLGYREFKNDMARPAFSNDIDYELDASGIIAYKSAKLQIIEADNTHVKYKVLSNFN